jgi:hypothetical protein
VGFCILILAIPQVFNMMHKTYTGKALTFPALFFILPASLVCGTLLMAWPTYILACIFSGTSEPLTYANTIVMTTALVLVLLVLYFKNKIIKKQIKNIIKGADSTDWILLTLVTIIVTTIMFLTFHVEDGQLCVGITVYSDFAPHLGMIRSFSTGNNFPTSYSHFAGEDIKYHFMFQFLVGNLEYLGMRLDFAFNIPSIICLVSVCMLLYSLSVKLFGKRAVGILGVTFFLFRSGSALTTYVSRINGTLSEIIQALKDNTTYIGDTTHEDWGLWNLNVYVNQRHLAFGLCIVIFAIMIMLEPVFESFSRTKKLLDEFDKNNVISLNTIGRRTSLFIKNLVFTGESWLPESFRRAIVVGLVIGMGAFFNGACIISCLLVLMFLAVITDHRLEYLIVAIIAVGLSSIQSSVFIDGSAVSFRWAPGFLAEVPTFFGTCDYLMDLLGILPFVILAAFLIMNGYYKWILFAFITPIIFAVTFQMTVDVAVNHKYIMIGCMLISVFTAAVIYRIFCRKGIMTKITAIFLAILLTCTGCYDFGCLIKKNSGDSCLKFALDDKVTQWVIDNSDASDIWLTDWYSLNNVVLGGAMLYYGWPYYAWSAGYDTDYRQEQTIAMFGANDVETLSSLIEENNIRYIIVDYSVRTNETYVVREDIISSAYECVYTNGDEGDWAMNIYDTSRRINNE